MIWAPLPLGGQESLGCQPASWASSGGGGHSTSARVGIPPHGLSSTCSPSPSPSSPSAAPSAPAGLATVGAGLGGVPAQGTCFPGHTAGTLAPRSRAGQHQGPHAPCTAAPPPRRDRGASPPPEQTSPLAEASSPGHWRIQRERHGGGGLSPFPGQDPSSACQQPVWGGPSEGSAVLRTAGMIPLIPPSAPGGAFLLLRAPCKRPGWECAAGS